MKTTTKAKAGNRIKHFGGKFGTITKINKGIAKYSITWDGGKTEIYSQKEFGKWCEVCNSLSSSTSAQESVQVSHWQQLNLEDLCSSDSAKSMTTAEISSSLDFQKCQFTKTLEDLQLVLPTPEFALLQPVPLANPSRSKESAKEPTMNATVSQQSLTSSSQLSLNFSQSKTCQDSLAVDISPESINPTLAFYSRNFPAAGTMSNGLLYPADILRPPGADKDCFWLESPGALSSLSSRNPSQSRLEAQLKKSGDLKKGECLDPEWLEEQFKIPKNWTNPSELRPATKLLEIDEPHSETVSTPELPLSPCEESCTCPSCAELLLRLKDGCGICGWFPSKRKRSPNLKVASGSISACTSIKKGKPYTSYQYSYDVRDPDTKRGWRTAKVGVPRFKREAIANLINQGKPIAEILEALKR